MQHKLCEVAVTVNKYEGACLDRHACKDPGTGCYLKIKLYRSVVVMYSWFLVQVLVLYDDITQAD